MNYFVIRGRLGAGLWIAGLLEIAMVLGYYSLSKAVDAGEDAGTPYILCSMGIWLNAAAFVVLLFGYLFGYRILGISRETWINGRENTSLDDACNQNPQTPSTALSITAWLPTLALLAVVAGLAAVIVVKQQRNPSLFEVVKNGSVTELNMRLDKNASGIDVKDKEGFTPLMLAVDAGRSDMVEALLSKGAMVDAVDRSGQTALIHSLGNPELVEKLLQKGANVNVRDKAGLAAIHWAVRKGSEDDVRLLLLYGAQVNVRNNEADTPLLLAVKGRSEVVDLLLMNGADPNLADQIGETPLHHAAMQDDLSVAQSLIAAKADITAFSMQGWAPLHLASLNGSLSVVAALLQTGVNVDLENRRSQTPLACAILKGHDKVVEYLLDHGADISRVDRSGNTYLHIALIEHEDEIAAQLIKAGADVDISNDAGVTPAKLMKMEGKASLLTTQHSTASL